MRYADALIMGRQYEADAGRVWAALRERLAQFGLMLHEGTTRLIECGRFLAERRRRCGERRPKTFPSLGFTHYCGWTRDGRFVVMRRTERLHLGRKLGTR